MYQSCIIKFERITIDNLKIHHIETTFFELYSYKSPYDIKSRDQL